MSCQCNKHTIVESVIKSDYKLTYSKNDIKQWITFGIDNGYITHNSDSKDIIDWVKLLSSENIKINETIKYLTSNK